MILLRWKKLSRKERILITSTTYTYRLSMSHHVFSLDTNRSTPAGCTHFTRISPHPIQANCCISCTKCPTVYNLQKPKATSRKLVQKVQRWPSQHKQPAQGLISNFLSSVRMLRIAWLLPFPVPAATCHAHSKSRNCCSVKCVIVHLEELRENFKGSLLAKFNNWAE